MSGHSESCDESRDLCDALFQRLSRRIEHLQRSQSMRWCGFFEEGRKRFAYVNHRKRMTRIEVWCMGEPDDLVKLSHLPIKPRTATSGEFGQDFQARFFVNNLSEIDSAAELLGLVSYRLS